MSISNLLLGLLLILWGATQLTWLSIDAKTLGLLAFITGIIILIDSYHPINITKP